MTPEDRAVLVPYVRSLADAMGMRDWTLELEYNVDDVSHAASMNSTYGKHTAHISFCGEFRTMESEFQREAVVHELLHVPYEGESWYLNETLGPLLGSATWEAVKQAIRQEQERATDTLAKAFAPFFPLIEWPAVPLTVVK